MHKEDHEKYKNEASNRQPLMVFNLKHVYFVFFFNNIHKQCVDKKSQ